MTWGVAQKLKKIGEKIRLGYATPHLNKSFKGTIIELAGQEGYQFVAFMPVRLMTKGDTVRSVSTFNASIHIYCKIIGFKDDNAPIRDWGVHLPIDYKREANGSN